MASLPPVKFKLTGTLPASKVAILTSEPPTLAGRITPIIDWSAQWLRSQRQKSRLAMSVLP